MVYILYNRQ